MIAQVETIPELKNEGFPKRIRLKKESEFKQILLCDNKKKGDNLIVYRLRGDSVPGQRFGIKMGKGIKKATDRNKIKRAIREVLRKSKDRFDKNECVVVLCKSPAEGIDLHKLREELESLIY